MNENDVPGTRRADPDRKHARQGPSRTSGTRKSSVKALEEVEAGAGVNRFDELAILR